MTTEKNSNSVLQNSAISR